jgi:hypothetical protein
LVDEIIIIINWKLSATYYQFMIHGVAIKIRMIDGTNVLVG